MAKSFIKVLGILPAATPFTAPTKFRPCLKALPQPRPPDEDAAHFMVRMVHQYPHEVTIYAAGPMTDLALAIALDPHFPELAKELIVMGGSINPTDRRPGIQSHPAP